MQWDYSMWRRVEDRQREAYESVAEQRLLNQIAQEGGRRPRLLDSLVRFIRARHRRHREPATAHVGSSRTLVSVILTSALVGALVTSARAASPADVVRNLAENVLGSGVVKAIRITADGRTVLLRWESATYRTPRALEITRELLYAEAVLTTGSIMGRLPEITQVRFTIMQGSQVLATGMNRRGEGVRLVFATHLGGGTYIPAPPNGDPTKSTGGSDVKTE